MVNNTVFLYPGQGSQFPGMAADLYDHYESVKSLFDMASEVCDRDMKELVFEASDEKLTETENAQPAIVLASLAALEGMKAEGISSTGAAGHSLGEYTAMVDAGVLTARDALKAVTARGKFMAAAGAEIIAQKGPVGMSVVLGIEPKVVCEVLDGMEDVWSANENAQVQVAIGGTTAGMEGARKALMDAGARKIIPLKVSCPFHTPLMAGPAESMKSVLAGIQFNNPVKNVWSNVLAAPLKSGDEARSLLVEQVTHPVRWVDLQASIAHFSPSALFEVGPGKVLCGLWAKSGLGGTCLPAGKLGEIMSINKSA